MKAIKGLVLFLGVLLVGGLGLLGYGLYAKKPANKAMVQSPAATLAEFGAINVPIPAGSRIEQISVAGERVVIRLSGPGPERLMVMDPAQGRIVGSFILTPEPAVR